jgi:transcriptional regulator
MYVPPAFKMDLDAAWAFVAARGFGTLIAVDGAKPTAVHVPFVLDRSMGRDRIALHVARANPIHDVIRRQPDVLITIMGPDAYISPDWYVAKDQVPTWTYVSVHLAGVAQVLPTDALLNHVDQLSDAFEAQLAPKPIWKNTKMTPSKRDAMLSAIVGIQIVVTSLEAQWKLGQHKPRADRHEVIRMLQWRGDRGSADVAALMTEILKTETRKTEIKQPGNL